MASHSKIRRCKKCGQVFADLTGRCPDCKWRTPEAWKRIALMLSCVALALGLLAVTWVLASRMAGY